MDELIWIIVNSFLYVFFLFYSIKRKNNILILISAIWTFSSIMGIFYFLNPFRNMPNKITLFPFIYLFSIIIIGCVPFLYYNENKVKNIRIIHNQTCFNFLIYVFALFSFLPLFESLVQLGKTGLGNLANVYETKRHLSGFSSRGYFSPIGWFCFSVIDYFKFVIPTFLFVYMCKNNQAKLILVGLFFAFLNPLLNNLVNGQRFYFVITIYSFLYNYLLFYNIIKPEIKKLIMKLFVITIILFTLVFIAISISRFGKYSNDEYGTAYQIMRYLGESFCNFNSECFWVNSFTDGKNSFVGFYSYFTDDKMSIMEQNQITGILTNFFHTYVGNFVMDFGLIKAFLLLLILSMFFVKQSNVKRNSLNLGTIILMNLYANIILFGTTYFIYQNGFTAMLWAIIISIIFKILPVGRIKM